MCGGGGGKGVNPSGTAASQSPKHGNPGPSSPLPLPLLDAPELPDDPTGNGLPAWWLPQLAALAAVTTRANSPWTAIA